MHEARTWRELLASIIQDNTEKQRLLEQLRVSSITLTRWINGESEPRPQNIRALVKALPAYSEELIGLMRKEKDMVDLPKPFEEDLVKEIPSEFYARVLVGQATTSEHLHFWSMCQLIIQQALGQLDPDRHGMSLWIVRCMPPSGSAQKVRSLRESIGQGTPPWPGNLEQSAMFLGAESLSGSVITSCRPDIIHDLEQEPDMRAFTRTEFEKSCAIFPILYAGRVAGVFLASSTQKNYFLSHARVELLQRYADLVALAFDPADFYEPDQLALCIMPPQSTQRTYFSRFRQRVADTMVHAARQNKPLNNVEADMQVWQKLEEELLQLPIRDDNTPQIKK